MQVKGDKFFDGAETYRRLLVACGHPDNKLSGLPELFAAFFLKI
jgi:hypothetical protein